MEQSTHTLTFTNSITLNDLQIYPVVLNIKERKAKRNYIKKHLDKHDIKYNMCYVNKNEENPKKGCFTSHQSIIKAAAETPGINYIMIIEDDAKFIDNIFKLKAFPPRWDMIYLGGTVHRILDNDYIDSGYTRVQTWTTHAYILNLQNLNLINTLMNLDYEQNKVMEIDRYYLEKIHPNYNCYMTNPMICLQREGFSDIENKEVNYDFMQHTLKGLRLPESDVDRDGNYVLKLPNIPDSELPAISIITPTYNRRKLFNMAIFNFNNFIYPKNKIEWIIIDDTNTKKNDSIEDMLQYNDKRIKYIHLDNDEDKPMTVAMKRNIGVSNALNPYIVHMDDDDYYPPESLLARIKILLKYENQGIGCVGCSLIGTYNIITDISSMSSDGPISLSEASMAYTRKFWEERGFDDECLRGEHKYFTEGRLDKIMDIPYSFVIIAINHRNNFTEDLRQPTVSSNDTNDTTDTANTNSKNKGVLKNKNGEVANFMDTWDVDTQMFIINLRKFLV